MSKNFICCLILLAIPVPAAAQIAAELKVVADFPNSSARVESIDQKSRTITIQPHPQPERGWVCWWYFKVEGVQPGETLTVQVVGSGFTIPDRAAYSEDDKTWKQTEPGEKQKDRITFKQKVSGKEAWFAWGPPFALKQANALIQRWVKDSPHASAFELCKSKDGRAVPGLKVQQAGVKDEERLGIWVHARQHAWECGSSWVCQGFVDWLLSNDASAEALRKKATVWIVPIMDVDSVERGAGGKNQKPHDHNRDWSDKPIYPEVQAAIKHIAEVDKAGRFDLFMDLHNPGPGEKQPFFFIPPPELLSVNGRRNLDSFLQACRTEMRGPLKLQDKPKESGENYDANWRRISKNFVRASSRDHVVSVCLETAWNTPHSTTEGYQGVGKELGRAMERYFREATRGK